MNTILLLRSIPLFHGLTEDDLSALAGELKSRAFQAGELIFAQGDSGNAMYIIESGEVNIHLPGEASRRISLADLARGEFFGELALFDEQLRSASALATTDVVVLELQHAHLERYLANRPRAAMAILRTMSQRLRQTNTLLSGRVAKNVDEEFERNLSWSERLADVTAALNGSWRFIFFLVTLTVVWCVLNSNVVFASPPDPYLPVIQSGIRHSRGPAGSAHRHESEPASARSRARDTDFKVNLKNEANIETLLRELGEVRAELQRRGGTGQ
jgi:CRP-like cAMP-binding protein